MFVNRKPVNEGLVTLQQNFYDHNCHFVKLSCFIIVFTIVTSQRSIRISCWVLRPEDVLVWLCFQWLLSKLDMRYILIHSSSFYTSCYSVSQFYNIWVIYTIHNLSGSDFFLILSLPKKSIVKVTFFQRVPRLLALPSLIIFQFKTLVVSFPRKGVFMTRYLVIRQLKD